MYSYYCYHSDKKIVISNLAVAKIKKQFGYKFEVLTYAKEFESIDLITPRIARQHPDYEIVSKFKTKWVINDEQRKKISDSKKGKPRHPNTKARISRTLKGRSSFQGKKHTKETKEIMAKKKIGNTFVKDTIWAFDPRGTKEIRVRSYTDIPVGFSRGRDYYSIEPLIMSVYQRSTMSPKGKQSKDQGFHTY